MGGVDQDRTWRRFRGSASSLSATPAHARAPARPALRARPTRRARPRAPAAGSGNRKPGSPEAFGCSRLDGRLAFPHLSFLCGFRHTGIRFPHLRNGRNIWVPFSDCLGDLEQDHTSKCIHTHPVKRTVARSQCRCAFVAAFNKWFKVVSSAFLCWRRSPHLHWIHLFHLYPSLSTCYMPCPVLGAGETAM